MKSLTALFLLEKAINAFLQQHVEARQHFTELAGKTLAINVSGVEFKFFIIFTEQKIYLQHHCTGEPDLLISAPFFTLINLFGQQDMNQLLFSDDMEIKGDLILAQKVKQFFAEVDVEWEYYLSQLVGDVAANEAKRCFVNNKERIKQLAKRFRGNMVEYLQEEANWLPSKNLAQDFFMAVDALKNDVARLELRIKRFQQAQKQRKE